MKIIVNAGIVEEGGNIYIEFLIVHINKIKIWVFLVQFKVRPKWKIYLWSKNILSKLIESLYFPEHHEPKVIIHSVYPRDTPAK